MKELIFGIIGGTALLMFGVDKMGEGLEKASGQMMKKMLSVLTGKVWSAFLVGIFLTALVQSSTAITVLTVGFVNAGLMKLSQAVGIIYGANIGTTITAQLMALSFDFNLTDFALPILGLGFVISQSKSIETVRNFGEAMFGFGTMFLGLKILNSGIPFIRNSHILKYFFEHYASIPIVGILIGIIATALVHSSAATVGLVIVLGQAGLLDLKSAIAIMLGDNIGTCITAQIASLTGNINARRTAWAHTLYNVFGAVMIAPILSKFTQFVSFLTLRLQPNATIGTTIANSHTLFNLLSAIIFLPFTGLYVKFLETIIRNGDKFENKPMYLNELLLDTPVAAFKAASAETIRAAEITKDMITKAMESFYTNNNKNFDFIIHSEENIDRLQKEITSYVIKVSQKPLSCSESRIVQGLLNCINNIERIGDHAEELMYLAKIKIDKNLIFSNEAIQDIRSLQSKMLEMYIDTIAALKKDDKILALKITNLKNQIDDMSKQLADNHIRRLQEGKCMIEAGVVLNDMINHFERITDHIYKVHMSAAKELCLIQ